MLNRRLAILGGILVVVAALLGSAHLTVAQEGPPPVQPADVGSQADPVVWDQLEPVVGGLTVASYVTGTESGLAADDFFVTGTEPIHTAWIISYVVVRASVDRYFAAGAEKASVCFYGDSNGPMATAMACRTGLSPSGKYDEGNYNWVLTYTIPSSPLLLTTSPRYWLSVQMAGSPLAQWNWRSRSGSDDNPHAGSQPFAYRATANWFPGIYTTACRGKWQVQSTFSNCNSDAGWPAGKDLAFKVVGIAFDGTFLPTAYLPFVRR